MAFLPIYAKSVFGGTLDALASLELALGLGTLAGTLLLSVFATDRAQRLRAAGIALLATAAAYLGFTMSLSLTAGCVALAGLGAFLSFTNVLLLSYFQETPEPAEVPVIMSAVNLISVASVPFSMSMLGWLIVRFPVRELATGAALLLIAVVAATLLLLTLSERRLLRRPAHG
jgi:predicted MFS family arabinose efflux permease